MNSVVFFIIMLAAVMTQVESETTCVWKTHPNSLIKGYKGRFPRISLDECKDKCKKADTFKCVSISYEKAKSTCHLSDTTLAEALKKNLNRDNTAYDLIVLECKTQEKVWQITQCNEGTKPLSSDSVVLDGTFGTRAQHEHCKAIRSPAVNNGNYEISVDIRNNKGWAGINSGHPGVIFNFKDSDNYDMVYVRPHSAAHCYSAGYQVNGKWKALKTSRCPQGPPKGGAWFNLKVKMIGSKALIYMDDSLMVEYTPHFSLKGLGGVFVWLGYGNTATFKNYKISSINSDYWQVRSCDGGTKSTSASYALLDGTFGGRSSLCQAIASKKVAGTNYEISVKVKNNQGLKGINYGHPGLVFNVKDYRNYDMIFFRPHSDKSCYQTGYKVNGRWYGMTTGACPAGPPKGQVWFNVKVKVINSKASVYVDDKLMVSYVTKYTATGQAGVFLWLGYNNIAEFKDFNIYPIKDTNSNSWEIRSCDLGTKSSPDQLLLDGTHGSGATQCQALASTVVTGNYKISVDVKNTKGWKGINSGHPGVFFNAKDYNNYDIIYFRPHLAKNCFQTGYKKNGKWVALNTGPCPDGPPKGGVSFNVRVEVKLNKVKVYINNKLVVEYYSHYRTEGRAGVFLWNGYNNIVEYKNFQLKYLTK